MGEQAPEPSTQGPSFPPLSSPPPSSPSTPVSPYSLIGETLSGYRIKDLLGAGGMGVVYKAFDEKLQRFVAIKLLPQHKKEAEQMEQLHVEAKTVAQLQHPNIVSVYVLGEDKGRVFFVMELCEGKTLDKLMLERKNSPIKSKKILPLEQSLKILREVGQALSYAHKKGIIHRDVKPGNVILQGDGVCKLMDFGLACLTHKASVDPSTIAGTPAYMSPEQTTGQMLDGRSDQFSLGVIFYELLTGRSPFKADSARALFQEIHTAVPPPPSSVNPDVSTDVDAVVFVMMEKSKEDRYVNMEECLTDLEKLSQSKNTSAFEKVSSYRSSPGKRKGTTKVYKLKRGKDKNSWKYCRWGLILALVLGALCAAWNPASKFLRKTTRSELSRESRDLQLAKNYLGINRMDLARPILESLSEKQPPSPETPEARALLSKITGKHSEL